MLCIWGPTRLVAMLWVYFDESGLHKKNPDALEWLVLGGAIASQAAWECITKEWDKALNDYEISIFHMADFESNKGEFERFKNKKKDHELLLSRLLDPIVENIEYVFGASNWAGRYNKSYKQIHLQCVGDIFKSCNMLPHILEDEISIVMATHKDIKQKNVDDLFESILDSDKFVSCTVTDVAHNRGLQVADMLAYEMCRSIRDGKSARYPLKRIREAAEVKIFLYL
jgi:hypothetical protein